MERNSTMEDEAQLNTLIEELIKRDDIEALEKTVRGLEQFDFVKNLESVRVAWAVVVFHRESYDELTQILQSATFHPRWYPKLQYLWHEMHYRIAQRRRGTPLGPVTKYRLRKKYPFPRTIWDGEEVTYNRKVVSRNILKEFYANCKYPNLREKECLARRSGLTVRQVVHWMKNQRANDKKMAAQGETKCKKQRRQQTPNVQNEENIQQHVVDDGSLTVEELNILPLYTLQHQDFQSDTAQPLNFMIQNDFIERTTLNDLGQPQETLIYQNYTAEELRTCSLYRESRESTNSISEPGCSTATAAYPLYQCGTKPINCDPGIERDTELIEY